MNNISQKYSIYRDCELIAEKVPSLAATDAYARNDARKEYAHGRPAQYLITGPNGFKREGSHFKGRLRWNEGKLKLGTLHDIGRCV
jgi:hypothetical protein